MIPELRLRPLNDRPARPDGEFVLYWMVAQRRLRHNFALEHAAELAERFRRPLVVLEGLNAGYRWACERFHRFVIDGMRDHAAEARELALTYYPYVEPEAGAGAGLLTALSRRACAIVTDDFPCFELPRFTAAGASAAEVQTVAVDSNGLLPLAAAERVFPTAHSFRRFLQKRLLPHLLEPPRENPLAGRVLPPEATVPEEIALRWRPFDLDGGGPLPVPSDVGVAPLRGGPRAGEARLASFLDRLDGYADERNHPDREAPSGLSPYLHFGHVSSHEVFREIAEREDWNPDRTSSRTDGSRAGWWGMSPPAEAFLDQLVTWRELGYNLCRLRSDYDRFESLPDWARATLAEHAGDAREHVYDLETFAASRTHDRLWNAAQTQLRTEGVMHNYLRMVWGKKILEWTESPRDALAVMIELNNRYALDGRNPNSYSGIFWVLGRYDRAWGPERPIFGKVRYMSLANTARKVRLKAYLERYGPDAAS